MSAAMFVSLSIRRVIAGEAEEVAEKLADSIPQVGRLASVEKISGAVGDSAPGPLGYDVHTRRVRQPRTLATDHAGKILADFERSRPAKCGGAVSVSHFSHLI